jgi:hypothetical protein
LIFEAENGFMTRKTQGVVFLLTGLIVLCVVIVLFQRRDQPLMRIPNASNIQIGYAVKAPYIFLFPFDIWSRR